MLRRSINSDQNGNEVPTQLEDETRYKEIYSELLKAISENKEALNEIFQAGVSLLFSAAYTMVKGNTDLRDLSIIGSTAIYGVVKGYKSYASLKEILDNEERRECLDEIMMRNPKAIMDQWNREVISDFFNSLLENFGRGDVNTVPSVSVRNPSVVEEERETQR